MSYPKSGNTLIRFLILNYERLKSGVQVTHNHVTLNRLMPEIFQKSIRERSYIGYYKTHYILPFRKRKIIFLIRNPFDSLCSYYEYLLRTHDCHYSSINEFIKSNKGISLYIKHLKFRDKIMKYNKDNLIIKYEDIETNKAKIIYDILKFINSNYTGEYFKEIMISTDRSAMVQNESKSGTDKKFRDFSKRKDYRKYRNLIEYDLLNKINELEKYYYEK